MSDNVIRITPDHAKVLMPDSLNPVFEGWALSSVSMFRRFDHWPSASFTMSPATKDKTTYRVNQAVFSEMMTTIEDTMMSPYSDGPGVFTVKLVNPQNENQKLFFPGRLTSARSRTSTQSVDAAFTLIYDYARIELMDMSIYPDMRKYFLGSLNSAATADAMINAVDRVHDPDKEYPNSISVFLANVLELMFTRLSANKIWDFKALQEASGEEEASRLAQYAQHKLNLALLKKLTQILVKSANYTRIDEVDIDNNYSIRKYLVYHMTAGGGNMFQVVKSIMRSFYFHLICPLHEENGVPYFRWNNFHEDLPDSEDTPLSSSISASRRPQLGVNIYQVIVKHSKVASDFYQGDIVNGDKTGPPTGPPKINWRRLLKVSRGEDNGNLYGVYPKNLSPSMFIDGRIHLETAPQWVPDDKDSESSFIMKTHTEWLRWYENIGHRLPDEVRISFKNYINATTLDDSVKYFGEAMYLFHKYEKGKILSLLDWIAEMKFKNIIHMGSSVGGYDVSTDLSFAPGFRRIIKGGPDGDQLFSGYVTSNNISVSLSSHRGTFHSSVSFDYVKYPTVVKSLPQLSREITEPPFNLDELDSQMLSDGSFTV